MTMLRRALMCGAMLLAAPAAGWAQSPGQTFTESTTHTDNFNDIATTARQDTYQTRIVARIDGGATIYDQTFAQAYGTSLVDAAIAAAQAALNAALSPAPSIAGPTLVFSDVSPTGSVTDLVSTILTNTIVTQTFETTFGPADILIGPDKSVPYHVDDAIENFNTNTDTQFFYDRTFVTTETYLTSQTYELVGYPQQVAAGVPEPASLALLGLGLAGLAARRRLLRQ